MKSSLCPFRKIKHVRNNDFMCNYPCTQEITEAFGECYGEECALWSGKDCSLKQEKIDYSLEDLTNFLTGKNPWDN